MCDIWQVWGLGLRVNAKCTIHMYVQIGANKITPESLLRREDVTSDANSMQIKCQAFEHHKSNL